MGQEEKPKTSKRRATSKPDSEKKSKPKAKRARAGGKRARPFAQVDAQVCDVLMELMCASESDAVRVSAAKALMDQVKRNEAENDGNEARHDKKERASAIAEIRRIMGELADAKSGGGDGPDEVDQDGATGAADPAG